MGRWAQAKRRGGGPPVRPAVVLDSLTLTLSVDVIISWTTVTATPDTIRFERSDDSVVWTAYGDFPWNDGSEEFVDPAFYRATALQGGVTVTHVSNVVEVV